MLGDPVQIPVVTVHAEPWLTAPVTLGAMRLSGFVGAAATVCTADEMPDPLKPNPCEFVAAICAVRYLPTSALVAVYDAPFAPLIATHPAGTCANVEAWG